MATFKINYDVPGGGFYPDIKTDSFKRSTGTFTLLMSSVTL
ncbi:hypothetical protein ACLRGI_02515 [Paenarthrobacter nitroguajacolicus]